MTADAWRGHAGAERGSGMKRWKQWMRLSVIGAASFVLLVTVLPQVASGLGLGSLAKRLATSVPCSSGGAPGAAASSRCTPVGTVAGTTTVTGAPAGFSPSYLGAGACPASSRAALTCADPVYALPADGKYDLTLTVGLWKVAGLYELVPAGAEFIGKSTEIKVGAGTTITVKLTVAYQKPATLKGTVAVTGVPAGLSSLFLSVLACPSFAPYTGKSQPSACVTQDINQGSTPDSGSYRITDLPSGYWIAYPSVCTLFSCVVNAKAGRTVMLHPGTTSTADVTMSFLNAGIGLVSVKTTVTGAPHGFSGEPGFQFCGKQDGVTGCSEFGLSGASGYTLLPLPVGTWTFSGFYQVPPFYNAITGAPRSLTVVGGRRYTLNLTVPYRALGGTAGTITVLGVPAGVTVEGYTVEACPAGAGQYSPECVTEYSGPAGNGFEGATASGLQKLHRAGAIHAGTAGGSFNVFRLSTLTPGTWLLYPGYQTVFGSVTAPTGTRVAITAHRTTLARLTLPYQFPSLGAVVGTVDAIGVPEGGFQSGAEACAAPPTATSCTDEEQAGSDSNGNYQLPLPAGTWWVAGYIDVFGNGPSDQSISAPKKITVTNGMESSADFVVDAP